jgi:hypothetical protein
MLYRVQLNWAGFELTTLVVIGNDCTVIDPTAIRSWPRWPLARLVELYLRPFILLQRWVFFILPLCDFEY